MLAHLMFCRAMDELMTPLLYTRISLKVNSLILNKEDNQRSNLKFELPPVNVVNIFRKSQLGRLSGAT